MYTPSNRAQQLFRQPKPTVIACLTDARHLEMLHEIKDQGADMVEYRADLLPQGSLGALRDTLVTVRGIMPVLFTLRSINQNGQFAEGRTAQSDITRDVLEDVDAIDIELGSGREIELVDTARAYDVLSIISHHYMKTTPVVRTLLACQRNARSFKPDKVKIATMTIEADDVSRLDAVFTGRHDRDTIVMGMGEHGVASRQHFIRKGVAAVYTRPELAGIDGVVVGQQTTPEARQFIDQYYDNQSTA